MSLPLIIVGGGFIGSLTALALGKLGIFTEVLERSSTPHKLSGGRAISITHASQKKLESLGLWGKLEPHAQPLLEIHTQNHNQFLILDQKDSGGLPFGHMIEEELLLQILKQAVRESPFIKWQDSLSVSQLNFHQDFVEIILSCGTGVQTPLLIGADGRQSTVRELAQLPKFQWPYDQWGIVCIYAHSNPHHGIAYEKFLPTGPFAILPLIGKRSSIVWTAEDSLAEKLRTLSEDAFDREASLHMKEFQNLKRLTERRMHPLSGQFVPTFTKPRMALVGDAAHVIHPLAGQGLNLGIQDVAALAATLQQGISLGLDLGNAGLLKEYESTRRLDNLKLLGITHGLNRLFSNETKPLETFRTFGLKWVQESQGLRRFFAHEGMGN
jgi:2-octaprenyl-6-methoxyphenol hydroxylase